MQTLGRRWTAISLVVLALMSTAGPGALAQPPTHPSLRNAALPPLIPLRAIFASPRQKWAFRLSPDGRWLAWFERSDHRAIYLHVREIDGEGRKAIRVGRPGRALRWAEDNRRVLFLRDWRGDENYRLFVVDTQASDPAPRRLTPRRGVRVLFQQRFPDDPAHIFIRMNLRDRTVFDLYRIDIRSGASTLVAKNPGNAIYMVTDRTGRMIARYLRQPDRRWRLEARDRATERWKTLLVGSADERHFAYGHPPGDRFFFAMSSVGRDKAKLVRVDLRTGAETVLFGRNDVDLLGAWIDRETYRPLRVHSWPGYPEEHYFDAELERDLAVFKTGGPARIRIVSSSSGNRRLVVGVRTDRQATTHYLLDRQTGKKTPLSTHPIAAYRDSLSPMVPVSFRARDGLQLNGYLTVPAGTDGKNLPMVLKVHGGPWSRDRWGYDAVTQLLANRGYAVLSVNYRGSTGYGRAFGKAIGGEFARKAHDDLIDAVDWAVRRGIADPAKVAIYGRSYGGYAALVGLTFTPDTFAAGVNIVGVSDLVMLLENFPPYWKTYKQLWWEYVGDPAKPEDRADMAARSPINFVDRIKRPLLVAHGANDVRVGRANSDRLVAAMKMAGKPVEYLVFDDEGHRIDKPVNNIRLARRTELFLAKYLGGRTAGP